MDDGPGRLPRSATDVVDRAVLGAVTAAGELSRADLADRTGLSRGAVAAATDRLVAAGRLSPARASSPVTGRGRPARRYVLPHEDTTVVLVSLLRERRTEVTLVDPAGRPERQHDLGGDWTHQSWRAWSTGVARQLTAWGVAGAEVVVSVPAPWDDATGPVRSRRFPEAIREKILSRGGLELPEWLDAGLCERLSARLHAPVRARNDANLAGLGEMVHGAGRGDRLGLHLSVRDGIGACLVVDRSLVPGASGMGGELAHVQTDGEGGMCACGNRGCLATSTSAISTVDAVSALHGAPLTQDDVDALVEHGDPPALLFFGDLGRTLGAAVASTVTLLNPECLLVDATLGRAAASVAAGVREELVRRCPPTVVRAVRVAEGTLTHPRAAGARALVST